MDAYTSNRLKKEGMKTKEYFEEKHKDRIELINESAYPFSIEIESGCTYNYYGLTKRELFAAMAMQGLFSCGEHRYGSSPEGLSQYAVSIADALINELNKQNNE